ncbi:hypothetical protein [Exiguobacterium chiriqhucha]|uniref:Uncharacterized protein n=1 Tax=Exiguobacterium chiriqhucha RW-2 TaxID=1345023 RepID=U1LZX9_9BACL|nr:hypothetical protein [Exiguobacterium chiriqhucha]ERG68289.1 hypothetical protein M467_13495 [Exiguobacterium chiriqhucha RW-2]
MEPKLQHDPQVEQANHPNRQFEQTNTGGPKITVVTGMLLGALVGGLLALLSTSNRENTKQSFSSAKSSVGGLVDTVKQDPAGTASQVIGQVKAATEVIQDVATDVQNVYEKVAGEVDTVKQDVNKVVGTAQEAKSDLQSIGEKVVEAKDTALGKENATTEDKPQA